MAGGPEWFAPKRYGYGAGWPIAWQGWLLSAGYLAVVFAMAIGLPNQPLALLAALLLPTAAFMFLCAKTTRGGWRWRWGDED